MAAKDAKSAKKDNIFFRALCVFCGKMILCFLNLTNVGRALPDEPNACIAHPSMRTVLNVFVKDLKRLYVS